MKNKLVVRDSNIGIGLNEKWFFSSILGFNPHWDDEHYNKCISQEIVKLSTKNKLHLKRDVFDGSIMSGLRQPKPFSFFR